MKLKVFKYLFREEGWLPHGRTSTRSDVQYAVTHLEANIPKPFVKTTITKTRV